MKKVFVIGGAVVILVALYFAYHQIDIKKVSNVYSSVNSKSPVYTVNEQDMAKLCSGSNKGSACCESGAREILANKYTQITKYLDGCQAGYHANTLKCPGSLSWCEPDKK